ncbi:S9 family peptidase [Sphingosinicella soli]|uniref:Dipeptidyl aminopeptidase/acylaminoacyl peptidase n=1 Tax=Sphingosinicella soli TaxID=333708 RepID=A0A7W7B4N8_9SPHN|nr:DPP IV N-terminal domain-containing protein [Sphingosinicella soli]MBB4633880.1 dipeptidyl aminopeptidase/acylaminoacyl peptidase [Sphingosinicella soli]
MFKPLVGKALIGALALISGSCGSIDQIGMKERPPVLSRADFDRAALFYPDAVRNLVLNAAPVPNWIEGTDRFWYLHQMPDGFRFVTVDAATGAAEPAFNHEAVARTLSLELGRQVSPGHLPFTSIRYSPGQNTIVFSAGEKTFECSRDAAFCNTAKDAVADPAAAVSPDGKRSVFMRDNNLWLREIAGGAERPLTTDGTALFPYRYTAFRTTYVEERRGTAPPTYPGAAWSPDGRYVLAVRSDYRGAKTAPYVVEYLPPDSPRPIGHEIPMPTPSDAPKTPYVLSLIDLKDGGIVPVNGGALGFNDYAPYWALVGVPGWDMDDGELYLVTSTRDSRALGVVAVNLDTGAGRTVLEERGEHFLNLNPIDYHVPNVRLLADRNELLWWSQRSGWGHLYRYDAKTGALKNAVTTGDWAVFDIARVDEAAGFVYFTAGGREAGRNPYYRHFYRADLDGRNVRLLTPENADHIYSNFPVRGLNGHYDTPVQRFSPSGRFFVDTHSTVSEPPRTVVRSADGALIADVVEADARALLATGWTPPERLVAKSADGAHDIYGVLLKPTNFDKNRRYPVIEQIYAGPQVAFGPQGFTDSLGARAAWMQSLAELGFVIVIQDGRGTPRRSRAFHMAPMNDEDSFALADHVAGIRAAARSRPYMDMDRVGITGISFGGYASARAMLLFPDFYKAGVSIAGPHDYRTMISSISVERFFGVPGQGDAYARVDNLHLADRLQGRLMLIAGEIDQNVPFNQAVALSDALIRAGKEFDFVLVPNAAHDVGYHPYAVRRMAGFFVRHLKQEEPPLPFAQIPE